MTTYTQVCDKFVEQYGYTKMYIMVLKHNAKVKAENSKGVKDMEKIEDIK